MNTFIATILFATMIGCATTENKKTILETNLDNMSPTASGLSSNGLFFNSAEAAEKALAGYNYGLANLADGRVQAFVSGINGSGSDNNLIQNIPASTNTGAQNIQLSQATEQSEFPVVDLKEKKNGQAAIDALGDALPKVARAYDMTAERLENVLKNDSSAWIDEKGRLLYIDTTLLAPPQDQGQQVTATITNSSATSIASLASADPFALHSKLGSNRVIYLDFNGYAAVNSAWYSSGTLNQQAYDVDGNPGSFSTTELNNIKEIWQRVSEDYAPFDVDVTTQEPTADALRRTSNIDTQYGTRAVITRSTPQLCNQQCGGVAYVNVYSWYSSTTPDYYQPAWIFFDQLGNGSPKYVAEAISHEVGHTLNMLHDGTSTTGYYSGQGTGATGWAPIMGVGYYHPVTQWSKGEYPNANNFQDDVTVIAAAGTPLRVDDYPDTITTAAPLGVSNGIVNLDGIIGTRTDVDIFTFTTIGGSLQINIDPDSAAPNLDIQATLLDAHGTVVAQDNPTDSLSASLSVALSAGQYFLKIDGVGKGDLATGYSDYASLGQYHITGNYAQGTSLPPPTSVISALPTSGYVPLAVSFDGSNSSASAGNITNYSWNFGDSSVIGTGATAAHTYQTAGNYIATLTVTDSDGLKSSSTQSIQAMAPAVVSNNMKVKSTVLSRSISGTKSRCAATISVLTGTIPVSNATVYGYWSGSAITSISRITFSGTTAAATNTSGVTTEYGAWLPTMSHGSCAFTVTNVIKSGQSYDRSGAIAGSFTW